MFIDTEWFITQEGPHQGESHLTGWILDAIEINPQNWVPIAICPRCKCVIFRGTHPEDDITFSDTMSAHEDWHRETDFPDPY